MTNNEAKGNLIAIKNKYLANYGEDSIINILIDEYDIQAIDMAIQALEQEPSGDCISRQQAKAYLYDRIERLNDDELYDIFSKIIDDMVNELPSVKPQEPKTGHWIEKMDACECPYCHKAWDYFDNDTEDFDYCPKCGAKLSENPTGSKPEISSYYGLKSYVGKRSEE